MLTDSLKHYLDLSLLNYKDTIQQYKIEVVGYASKDGALIYDRQLSNRRAESVKIILFNTITFL